MAARKRFVLAVDGGGIRGLVALRLLETIETRLRAAGKAAPLHRYVDLMAGTGSGGLLVAGLAMPRPEDRSGTPAASLSDLRRFFEVECRELFRRRGLIERAVANPLAPFDHGFDERPFERLLKDRFGWASLQSALTRLVLTAYDLERREPVLLSNGLRADGRRASDFYAWQAVRATMALPLELPPMRAESLSGEADRLLVGGGLLLENPLLAAYREARRLGWEPRDLVILSLGTGTRQTPRPAAALGALDALGWLSPARGMPLVAAVAQGQAAATADLAGVALADAGAKVIRLDADLPDGAEATDNWRPANILALNGAADRVIRDNTRLLDELVATMQERDERVLAGLHG